jgi:ribonuclease P protein component
VFREKDVTSKIEPEAQKKTRLPEKERNTLRKGDPEPKTEKREKSPYCVKIQHIRKPEEFTHVLKKGIKKRGKTVSLCACQGEVSPGGRIKVGIKAAKRYVPKAVTRNYVRRVIYAFFARNEGTFKDGTKIVVTINRKITGTGKKELAREIRDQIGELAGEAGLIDA